MLPEAGRETVLCELYQKPFSSMTCVLQWDLLIFAKSSEVVYGGWQTVTEGKRGHVEEGD